MLERFSDKNLTSFLRTVVYFSSLHAQRLYNYSFLFFKTMHFITIYAQVKSRVCVNVISLMFSFVLDIFWC